MSSSPKLGEKKKLQLPHVFILLFGIIVLCSILTWIIPAGEFDRIENADGRMIAVAGSWHRVDAEPVGIFQMFKAVYDGMLSAADISMLIFLTFASTSFVIKSGAFDGLVVFLMKIFKGNSSIIIIPIFMALFGLGSSTVGMFEEWLPFIPVFASIFVGMGFDAVVGLAVVAFGAGIGFSGAAMNPFTMGVAQGIAEVPYMSGAGFRVICHIIMLAVASALIMRYALKVKKDPTKSVVYGTFLDKDHSKEEVVEDKEFGIRQVLVLIDLLVMIVILIWGVKNKGWYFAEISTLFLIMGIIAAIIMGYGPQKIGKTIAEGFAAAAVPALMVGVARGILMVLQAGTIIDTVVYGLSIPMSHFPAWLTGVAMLIMQTILNFFIPSGSGQAATSMPIMAPLADLLGVSRDTACLAFQFGDGLSNIMWPTAYAAVMSGLAGVKLDRWWKFAFPIFGILVLTQAALLIFSVMTGFGV